jgi:hypothetical protein
MADKETNSVSMEKKTNVVFAYVVKAEYTGKSLSCPRHVCSTAACIGFQLACPTAAFAAYGTLPPNYTEIFILRV